MLIHKLNRNFVALVFVTVVNVLSAKSQEFSFVNYDTRDGLGASVVYDALQSSEGFMWFATENGLSRFDGKNFKTFTTKDGLPDNEILRLFQDSEGRLWIMPFRPSICYYYKGKIYNESNDSLLAKIHLLSYAFDMAEDNHGDLFIIEMAAWHEISRDRTVKTTSQLNNIPIYVFAAGVNKRGEVEMLIHPKFTKPIFYLLNMERQTSEQLTKTPTWPDASTSMISPDYTIISSKHNSQLLFYKGLSKVISTKIPSNTISISYLNNGNITVNTRTGMEIFDPATSAFSDPMFRDFDITSAFQDKEDDLWLTTDGSGVLMIPSFQFRNYSFLNSQKNSGISALGKNGDTVFAGGWGKQIWQIGTDNMKVSSSTVPVADNEKVISILPFNNKMLFSSTAYYQNPFTANKRALTLKSVSVGKSGFIFASHAYAMLCDWSGHEKILWNSRSTSAVEKDSGFYIGTLNGLFYKSYEGEIVDLGKVFPVFASRIVNLLVSDNNVLWVTTKGNGVAAYANNKLLYHITEGDGLTSDNCTSLYIDTNTVWVGTNKGLNHIEIEGSKYNITRFSTSDGLHSNNVQAIVTIGKKVFVGTPLGLTYFEVDKISQASSCDLQLTGIYISNRYWTYDSTNFSLPHHYNDLRFEFSGISFKSAGDIKYRYRMLGLQPEWRTTSEKQLSFPSLPSGKYIFQLEAINKYGVASGIKQISFTVEKLLWEKTWFRILVLSLIVFAVWGLFRYRVHKIRTKEKEQAQINQRIAELEQKTLRSQMNPHFIFNSLNSIQHYVAERDITGANDFITDFSRLIRMTLDLSAHTSISMSDELQYITTYLKIEKARFENQFDYVINVDKTLDPHEIYLPPLLLQPYVENCIRHGIKYRKEGKGLIKIIVEKKESAILVGIEDNGVGREMAQKYKTKYHIQYQSKGTSINRDRIELLNSYNDKKIKIDIIDLYCENQKPEGTRVNIYLNNTLDIKK